MLPNSNSFRKFALDEQSESKLSRAQPSRDVGEQHSSFALGRAGSGFGSFCGWTSLHADSGRHGSGGHQDREARHRRLDSQLGLCGARPLVGLRLAQRQQTKLCSRHKEESWSGSGPSPGRTSRCCSGKLCARCRRPTYGPSAQRPRERGRAGGPRESRTGRPARRPEFREAVGGTSVRRSHPAQGTGGQT